MVAVARIPAPRAGPRTPSRSGIFCRISAVIASMAAALLRSTRLFGGTVHSKNRATPGGGWNGKFSPSSPPAAGDCGGVPTSRSTSIVMSPRR
jgi:hypothetical protein